ncbi:MAG: tetratricopeptide repeat protein [Candidatus Acidiferrales bacterium]
MKIRPKLCPLSIAACVFASLAMCSPAFSQHSHSAADAPSATLLPGMGSLHHEIATSNPEAQRFFDQGLTLVYAFNHEEAVRSFQRAAELDPKAAMPWWGVALALGPNYNDPGDPEKEKAAFDAVQKAKSLAAAGGPQNERAYIEVLALRYSGDPNADLKKQAHDYSRAMGELAKSYPDDPDAATIYAESMMDLRPWGLWALDGTPSEGTLELVAVLESVLARYPNHVGANHYYIHAVEASPHAAWGLQSADRLGTLVPNAGHLVHMPAHIYARVGDFPAAIKSNDVATEVDRNYIASTGAQGMYPAMYYSHNLHFLAYAAMQGGNSAEARNAAETLAENIHQRAQGMPPGMTDGFLIYPMAVRIRFREWQDLMAMPQPDAAMIANVAFWHFARGMAFASTGKLGDAEAEQKVFAAALAQIPEKQGFGFTTAANVMYIAATCLDARIAEARGDRSAAVEALTKAVAMQDALAYDEPPDWFFPARESLGGALLRAGKPAEAEVVFREDLIRNPRNGRSLFGLWQSLAAQNKTTDARWAETQFHAAWKVADVSLSIENL